jgi:membrane protein DedA with SNARE-associated domain
MINSLFLEHFPYAGLFALLILGGIGFPFPEDATLILSGFLISHNVVRPFPAFLVVYTGLLLSDSILYLFGKKYGRMIVTHKRFKKIISPEKLTFLENTFKRRGLLVILVGRHLAGLRAQIFLGAGILRMSFLKFIMADAFSSLFTIAVMVGAGYVGGNSLQIIKKDISKIEHGVIFLMIVFLLAYVFYRFFKYRSGSCGKN